MRRGARGRHGSRGWPARVARMAGGGGDVRRAAIRALPTGAKLKPEVPVFKTGASGIYSGCYMRDLLCPDRVLIGGRGTDAGRGAVRALREVYAHWVPG